MADGRQKYCPVQCVPGKHTSLNHVDENEADMPQMLGIPERQRTETRRMRTAKIKTVNPVTAGDRSMRHRVYEKGRKNQTRT